MHRALLLILFCTAACTPLSLQYRPEKNSTASSTPAPVPLKILRDSLASRNVSEQILALHAIHISMNDEAAELLEIDSYKETPEVELTKVQVLSSIRTESASKLLQAELMSDMLLIRAEALYALAERHDPSCYQHLEAEFSKVDPDFQYLFPELFALEGSSQSKQFLKNLLRHSNPEVRLGAVFTLYQTFPDELVSEIPYLRYDPYPAIQEIVLAASLSLRHADFEGTSGAIQQLVQSAPQGKLLYALDQNNQKYIEEEAKKNNLFAITSRLPKTLLQNELLSPDLQVRLNATIALLSKRDEACMKNIALLFCPDGRDYYFEKISSPGRILTAYRASPSASEQFRRQPGLYERDLALRYEWLAKSIELPEECFLQIASLIFKTEQNELIPLLVRLLENVRSEKAIALLKQEAEHFGSPFIRAASNLSLFRLGLHGPYYERLLEWIRRFNRHDLLKPRPTLPWSLKEMKERYSLSFEETSNLLVESYDALAESHKQEAIEALQEAIQQGNPHNRPLLAGLLLKAEA